MPTGKVEPFQERGSSWGLTLGWHQIQHHQMKTVTLTIETQLFHLPTVQIDGF